MSPRTRTDPRLHPDEATDHIRGPAGAPVTVIEYGDFECPACVRAQGALPDLLAHFGSQVRFVFRQFPLRDLHPLAELAAEASEAAAAQGQFWPMHARLFAHSPHLKTKHLLEHAGQLGLDMARFQNELKDHVYLQRVQEHVQAGQQLGVRQTPSFYVNGVLTDVSLGLQQLQAAVNRVLDPHN